MAINNPTTNSDFPMNEVTLYQETLDARDAARYMGLKVKALRDRIKVYTAEDGMVMRNPATGRRVLYIGMKHPVADCLMPGPFFRKLETAEAWGPQP